MKINIVCVGNLKEKYWVSATKEYLKRLEKYHKIEIVEVGEEKLPKKFSDADISRVQVKESLSLAKHFKGYIIILDIKGKNLDSEELSKNLENISAKNGQITFVIGGSYGLSEAVKLKANMLLSFSSFTFPHQLMRVILLEQLYRATTISNNIPYHK